MLAHAEAGFTDKVPALLARCPDRPCGAMFLLAVYQNGTRGVFEGDQLTPEQTLSTLNAGLDAIGCTLSTAGRIARLSAFSDAAAQDARTPVGSRFNPQRSQV